MPHRVFSSAGWSVGFDERRLCEVSVSEMLSPAGFLASATRSDLLLINRGRGKRPKSERKNRIVWLLGIKPKIPSVTDTDKGLFSFIHKIC